MSFQQLPLKNEDDTVNDQLLLKVSKKTLSYRANC